MPADSEPDVQDDWLDVPASFEAIAGPKGKKVKWNKMCYKYVTVMDVLYIVTLFCWQ
jgi:hypothetical protein